MASDSRQGCDLARPPLHGKHMQGGTWDTTDNHARHARKTGRRQTSQRCGVQGKTTQRQRGLLTMKYLSLLLLIGFTLGEKYDVQTGSSNEFFLSSQFKPNLFRKKTLLSKFLSLIFLVPR